MAVKANNIDIIKALNSDRGSAIYATFTTNDFEDITNVYNTILTTKTVRNDFVNALVNQIALISVNKAMFKNDLEFLKSAPMKYGQTEEEIFVNMISATDYNFFADEKEIFQLYKSNIMSAFHEINFRKRWAVTISYDELRNAFRDEYGLQSLVNAKTDVLYTSASYLEYLYTKNLLIGGYNKGCITPATVTEPSDEESVKALLEKIRGTVDSLRFPNPINNYAGSDSTASPEDVVFITTPFINAKLDVNALAYTFHVDRAEVNTRTILVDSLPDGVYGFIADVRFFKIREQLREFAENYRGDNLRWNYFYHLWEMFSISPFYSCVVLTSNSVVGNTITITGLDSVTKGSKTEYKATITDSANSGYIPQLIDYEITTTTTSPKTGLIAGSGILIVGDDETASTITLKATSRINSTVTTTKEITITS